MVMTDGERIVWATRYAIAVAGGVDAVAATRAAAAAVLQLRETAAARAIAPSEIDERQFLDEIVNVP